MKTIFRIIFLSSVFLLFISNQLKAQQRFKLIAEDCFNGILDNKEAELLNVLVIHGTGIKPYTYADKFMTYCTKETNCTNLDTSYVYGQKCDSVTVRKVTGTFENNRKIAFYIVHWSYYTKAEKEKTIKLEKDKNRRMASLSKLVKNKVLIEQLYDFVVFSNETFKDKIRSALDAAFTDIVSSSEGKKTSLNLVSGSLGSSIFVEYINKVQYNIASSAATLSKSDLNVYQSKIDYILSSNPKFYMLTNQVNFLESIIAQKSNFSEYLVKGNMEIVAFRHTNDVLCFYLPGDRASQFVNFMPCKVTNVRYKNFPFSNNIKAAHEKPFSLKKLHGAILYGSKYKKVKKERRKKRVKK